MNSLLKTFAYQVLSGVILGLWFFAITASAQEYTMYEEEQTVIAPIEFTTYCQTEDCIDRTYDIYVETGHQPITDWELSEVHRNEWNAYYGPDWVENGQPIDPLFEGSYNPRPRQAYCEYGLGCQFRE